MFFQTEYVQLRSFFAPVCSDSFKDSQSRVDNWRRYMNGSLFPAHYLAVHPNILQFSYASSRTHFDDCRHRGLQDLCADRSLGLLGNPNLPNKTMRTTGQTSSSAWTSGFSTCKQSHRNGSIHLLSNWITNCKCCETTALMSTGSFLRLR